MSQTNAEQNPCDILERLLPIRSADLLRSRSRGYIEETIVVWKCGRHGCWQSSGVEVNAGRRPSSSATPTDVITEMPRGGWLVS